MFHAFLRVARPDDWAGKLAWLGAMVATFLIALIPALARLPARWEGLFFGQTWAMRVALLLGTLWLLTQLRAVVYAALPHSVVLIGRRLRIPARLRGQWLRVSDIAAVHVDRRPGHEVFVLEMLDGSENDMCAVDWEGAGRVYSRLVARVARAARRRRSTERAARARARAEAGRSTKR